LALLEDSPRDLSARAIVDCALLKLDYATLIEVIRENPQVALHSMRRLSRRLKEQELQVLTAVARPAPSSSKSAKEVFSEIESSGAGAHPITAPRTLTQPRLVHPKVRAAVPVRAE